MTPEQRPGTEIAGYRIESLIGRGGMAVVYRAEDMRLGRKVALKLLTPLLADSEQFRQRFIKESRLAASLDHPNIVPIYEAGEADGQLFIAMRYVTGSDLKGLLADQGGHLPADRTLRLFTQIGDALDSAHRAGLVHRDVKPANILVVANQHTQHGSGDHVYLTDFGLTKRTSDLSGGLTGTGHFLGTVDYVAPEQIQGKPVGPGTDMYALGCVLYECLTGQLPFHRDDDAALLWAHLVEAPPPVTGIRPDLPAAINAVIARAMAKDPADRYATSGEFMHELVLALGMPVTVSSPRGGTEPGRGGRHAQANDGSLTGSGTVTGDVQSGSGHPSFPSAPLPMFPPQPGAAQEIPPPTDDEPEPEEDTEYADDDAWDEEGEEGEEAPPEQARRPRWGLIALIAAAVVLAVGAAVLVPSLLQSEEYRPYTSDATVVPFRLEIPDDWTAVVSAASDIVLGPAPTTADDVFFNHGRPEDWAEAADAVRTGSPDAVWLYASSSNTTFDESSAEALWSSLAVVLPDRSEFDGHRAVQVAGERADELEAFTFDPASPDTRLRVLVDVVQPSGGGGAVILAFFAPPDTFEEHRSTFEKVRDSLQLTR